MHKPFLQDNIKLESMLNCLIFANGGNWQLAINWHHLASRLVNMIREGKRQTKNLVLAISKKNPYLSFYNCCTVLCTISGFSNVKAV